MDLTESQRSGLNRRPPDYESGALPLSYAGESCILHVHALARTRTATPFGTTPSRWRVYQFHHQGRGEPGSGNREPQLREESLFPVPRSLFPVFPTGLTGLEPATSGVTDRHSNQLSYSPNSTSTA